MPHRYLLVLFALLLAVPTQAQTTFDVVVEPKSADHPNAGQGHPSAYVIDGEEANTLTLVRGETYVFEVGSGAATHPFYISTSESGGGAGEYTDGVTGSGATTGQTLTFVVPEDAPDLLYYQCQFHTFMGWEINIVDNTTGVEDDAQPLALRLDAAYPNPFSTQVRLALALDASRDVRVEAFDAAGRHVATLHAGRLAGDQEHTFVLDGSALADGVYVIRATAGDVFVERRVTLVR